MSSHKLICIIAVVAVVLFIIYDIAKSKHLLLRIKVLIWTFRVNVLIYRYEKVRDDPDADTYTKNACIVSINELTFGKEQMIKHMKMLKKIDKMGM